MPGCYIIVKNNVIHGKTNDICIAWMINHCKNNAIHNKINDICIAWMLTHCKTTLFIVKSMIYVLPGCYIIVKTTQYIELHTHSTLPKLEKHNKNNGLCMNLHTVVQIVL